MATTMPLRSGQSMSRMAIFGLGMVFSANEAVESDYLIVGRGRRASSCGQNFRAGGGRAVRAGRECTLILPPASKLAGDPDRMRQRRDEWGTQLVVVWLIG